MCITKEVFLTDSFGYGPVDGIDVFDKNCAVQANSSHVMVTGGYFALNKAYLLDIR